MSEVIITYTSGVGQNWDYYENAFDGDENIFASIILSAFNDDESLSATGNDNVLTQGEITKVETGVAAYYSGDEPTVFLFPPGWNDFDYVTSPTTLWEDITGYEDPWTWQKINDLQIESWVWAPYEGTTYFYVSKFMLRVTYTETESSWTTKVNGVLPTKINGIPVENIISIQ